MSAAEFDVRALLSGDTPASEPRWVKVIDQTRCIGCHACTTACRSENEVPLSVTRTYVKSVDVGTFPQATPRLPGHALQPVRGRAVRGGMPDGGDVPAAGRHRRLRQGGVHRLQGLHRRLPVRRDLHQPRGSLGREVQLLRAPARHRPRARLRSRLPGRGDPRRRPQRPGLARGADRQPGPGDGSAAGEGHATEAVLPRARTRRRSTRSRRGAPTAGCSCGASSTTAQAP